MTGGGAYGLGTKIMCESHQIERLALQEHINELTSPMPASWFDPTYAGERWDDDY